jgi:hypothetical protein
MFSLPPLFFGPQNVNLYKKWPPELMGVCFRMWPASDYLRAPGNREEESVRNPLVAGLIVVAARALLVCPPCDAAAPEADRLPPAGEIIERYIRAIGGREAVQRLDTRICIGRLVDDLAWKAPVYESVRIMAYAKSPGRVLIIEHNADGIRCEATDGEITWVQDAGGIKTGTEPMPSKMAWLLDPGSCLRMEDYFPDLQVTSRQVMDGVEVYVVEPAGLDRAHYALFFDASSGLLVRIGYFWELQEYREVDGVLFPFRVSISRKGGTTTYIFDLVKHNLPLKERLFAAPVGRHE